LPRRPRRSLRSRKRRGPASRIESRSPPSSRREEKHGLPPPSACTAGAKSATIEAGLAESLARPGKNVTGNATYAGVDIWGKLIELLREAKPGIRKVGILWSYVPPVFPAEEIAPLEPELKQA